jgi:predicted regulator of Ras-like GTPase activity (Roadblock/LC7/MglB family)
MTPQTAAAPAAPPSICSTSQNTQSTPTESAALAVPLKALAESWPETLRQEIVQTKLLDARLMLPWDAVERALKTGRAAFPWKTLRSWVAPAPLLDDSPNDQTELELSLKVLTPLFFARKKGQQEFSVQSPASRTKVTIDEGIPNLFFGFPSAADGDVCRVNRDQNLAPTPATGHLSQGAAQAGPVTKPVDTNYYVWDDNADSVLADESQYKPKTPGGTDFVARYATPNEIVSRAAALDGVAGALIALPDGLMVASRIPAELNGDTLAAFLPQIFAKVNQCTRELRMGELNNLNFTVGNVPWKIFRVNAIFFAAFGRVAEALPTAGLAALAAELDRKQKS